MFVGWLEHNRLHAKARPKQPQRKILHFQWVVLCLHFSDPSLLTGALLSPRHKAQIQARRSKSRQPQLDWAYLDYKLMDLPNDLAAKALLLEKTWDLERQFGEEYFVIWAGKRQTCQVIAPRANSAALNIRDSYGNNSQLFIHQPISRICFVPALAGIFC
jgi:hypothetical protein